MYFFKYYHSRTFLVGGCSSISQDCSDNLNLYILSRAIFSNPVAYLRTQNGSAEYIDNATTILS
jgi:hypothetical protein